MTLPYYFYMISMLMPYNQVYANSSFLHKKTGRLAAHVRTAATAGLFHQTIPYIVTARLPFVKKHRYFMDAMYSRYSSFVMRGL